ncbi:MAG TPA: tetratricopeptide repeat protein [Candidatus Udaeobacter sp.]|nr:tetratricopeptide repeat protein [Candidatus Udaeobacter sp.]
MERHRALDAAGRAAKRRLIFLLLLLFLPQRALAQAGDPAAEKISETKQLYEAGNWDGVVRLVAQSPDEPADLLLYRGLALARLERWEEAKAAFSAGGEKAPGDPRFLIELAGIAYREKQFSEAKQELRRALAMNPKADYANNFLASIYFQEGNLEAALKYWNRTGKPKLEDLTFEPAPKLRPLVLDRAFAFARGAECQREQFLTAQARLRALNLYPGMFFELRAHDDGTFDLGFHAAERNGWGSSKWEGVVSLLRDIPFQAVDPEFYNLGRAGVNWVSTFRWDDEKRRVFTEVSAPVFQNPAARFRVFFDGRNENWNITHTFTPGSPSFARLNLEKAVAGAEMRFVESGRWEWSAGVEYNYRDFRNLFGIPSSATPFFTDGSALALKSSVQRWLIRFPERRFTLNSRGSGEFGTLFRDPLGRYGRLEGTLAARWLPSARGDDYETQVSLRGGRTIGNVPFDELFTLGFDRDTPLWLRGHPGLQDGQKGNAPLGRNYVLLNAETDKIIYRNGIFTLKAGPFLDTGRTYDPSGFFGSPKWLWDTGVQAKIRVLGGVQVVLGYGKDLRSGRNSFFTTVTK